MSAAPISCSSPPYHKSDEWNCQAGRVLQSVGTRFFHRELVRLMELSVKTDALWIIRYASAAQPDVIFTHNVPKRVRQMYLEKCIDIDPFASRWKTEREAGVYSLKSIKTKNENDALYKKIFTAFSGMNDELGIIVPLTDISCVSIFLERKHGRFVNAEIMLLRELYPLINNICCLHLSWTFHDMIESKHIIFDEKSVMIRDHAGYCVYSSPSWDESIINHSFLANKILGKLPDESECHVSDGFALRIERLKSEFPLAPNGALYTIDSIEGEGRVEKPALDTDIFEMFTKRERDVLKLLLRGMDNQEISGALNVGVGTIRNLKTRLYRKAGVFSEGELVLKFLPLMGEL